METTLFIPIIISFLTNVFDYHCGPYLPHSNDYLTGDECNKTRGPTMLIFENGKYQLMDMSGKKVEQEIPEVLKIIGYKQETYRLNYYGKDSVMTIWLASDDLDLIRSTLKRFTFNNLHKMGDCLANDFFMFHPSDSFTVEIPPFRLKSYMGELPKTRVKRGIQCNGVGIGAGYGVGITIVGVATHSWCDTTSLELEMEKKYDSKFEDFSSDLYKTVNTVKEKGAEIELQGDQLKSQVNKILADIQGQDQINDKLKTNIDDLQEWFDEENQLISQKIEYVAIKEKLKLTIVQIELMQHIIFGKTEFMLNTWILNSRFNNCRYSSLDDISPLAGFTHTLKLKKVDIENINLKGKVSSLMNLMVHAINTTTTHDRILSKAVLVNDDHVQTISGNVLTSVEKIKQLGEITREGLNHLKSTTDGWKMYLIAAIAFIKGSCLLVLSILSYLAQYRKNPNHKQLISQVLGILHLITGILGICYIVEGVIIFV